ncbi:MAG: acylphosphatase [Leptolyngbya sp. PLA3]|nr:MAG: acylphosphatase [Cyanobacteria bacterium CYA]MCE7968638.1 acylphosphatase [Leptolyngbya sp. PL-A3]
MKRRVIVYRGRVQGVGFRAATRELARPLPVSGWVRNDPDGSVRLEVQGDELDIARLLTMIRRDRGLFITSEQTGELDPVPGEAGFEIRYR